MDTQANPFWLVKQSIALGQLENEVSCTSVFRSRMSILVDRALAVSGRYNQYRVSIPAMRDRLGIYI